MKSVELCNAISSVLSQLSGEESGRPVSMTARLATRKRRRGKSHAKRTAIGAPGQWAISPGWWATPPSEARLGKFWGPHAANQTGAASPLTKRQRPAGPAEPELASLRTGTMNHRLDVGPRLGAEGANQLKRIVLAAVTASVLIVSAASSAQADPHNGGGPHKSDPTCGISPNPAAVGEVYVVSASGIPILSATTCG
jgi:hypothetical protein